LKRWLYLLHRWLGLGACLLVLLWFATGFVMMYVPFPELTQTERLSALPAIDTARLQAPPATASAAEVQRLRLLQPLDEPVFARLGPGGWSAVSARTDQPLKVDAGLARRVAERFAGSASVGAELVDRDQWSVSSSLDPHRPLWAVDMADGGRHYVSSRTGELVRDTARAERTWNWVGAVIHWVYPTVLRSQPRAWHWVVVVLSGYALLTALLGTAIGLLRWRRYANGRRTPYRGWMRWHHLLGLAGAVFVLSWLFSGLMSMNPFSVFSSQGVPPAWMQAWRNAPLEAPWPPPSGARETEWLPDRDGALVVSRDARGTTVTQRGRPVDIDAAFLRRRVASLGLGEPKAIERLDVADVYLSGRSAPPALPVWRLRFGNADDAADLWLHVDGRTGQPLARLDRSARAERWLYHGLHSWDFDLLLQRRPLWDLLMLPALALGTALSMTSIVIAWRRLRRQRPFRPGASP